MPMEFLDPVSSATDDLATLEWTLRNSCNDKFFDDKNVQFIDSTPKCLWGERWYIRIFPSNKTSVFKMWLRRQCNDNNAVQNFRYTFRITNYNEDEIYFESKESECFFGRSVNCTSINPFNIPQKYQNLKEVFKKHTTIKIFCFLHLLTDSTLPLSKGVKRKCEDSSGEDSKRTNVKGIVKLTHLLKSLFVTGKESDVVLSVKGREFPAHQLILKCQSSVFECMFNHEMLEKSTGVVNITDCNPDAFNDFLLYLYCREMPELTCDNVIDLHYISHKYDVAELTTACLEFMIDNLSLQTFYDFIVIGYQSQDNALLESGNDFFLRNFKPICSSEKWKKFFIERPDAAHSLMVRALKQSQVIRVKLP